ncbi:MAG: xanthine dehydrogenase family protein molybdopterin-binding subunit [Acidobacteria bacterium]|nr:xanthine dehydrogenase family protein molybdopterin-binding subunit [Acidobacteriota bacterium]MBI3425408.1 xanthine dehydrogenase family protein molybdopterin-binding subunit [Acidobacteriota bacterium]
MNELLNDYELEPERYELHAAPAYHFEMPRRDFFKALGCGVLIVLALNEAEAQQESGGARRGGGARTPQEIGAWLHVGENGAVTVYTGKVEVGQGIRTSLAQIVAEELRVPMSSIQLVMGDTDLTPYDAGTFGSNTTPGMNPRLRRAAAAAREALLDLAAEQFKAERAALRAADGKIANTATNQSISYGQLTKGQKLLKAINDNVALTPHEQWKVAGKPVHRVNGRDIVTGKHRYTTDLKRPDMLFGKVLRPVANGATLTSLDAKAAESLPGVTVVRDGDFVGVTAPSTQLATQALAALRAEWKTTPQPSAQTIFDYFKQNAGQNAGQNAAPAQGNNNERGSIAAGLAAAQHKLEGRYTVAYIAHAPLEPRAAIAEWQDRKLTVWTGTQRPFGVRSELASALRLPEEKVRVIMPDTGSGYGGKHTGEAAIEAARLAKAAGKPVKLVWTREEEFAWAYFRPAGLIEITSGADKDGKLTAWEFHNYNSGTAGLRPIYEIPNQKNEFHSVRSPLRQGSYRALASTANHFAREVHLDELAESLKLDPLEFRLRNLKDERMRAVLTAAAKAFGWGQTKPAVQHGFGIAGGFEKAGYVANCVEVAITNGKVKLVRVVTAFECGTIINPDGLHHQVEGSIIQGIGGALFEAIDFADGKVLNPRFSRYRVPRFSDLPKLETVLLDRPDLPSAGAGECPIVALAPAVSGAIFMATGQRLRSLPLAPNGLKA